MDQFRRYGGYPALVRNVDLPIAHKKDPRIRAPAFNPAGHPNQAQMEELAHAVDTRAISLEEALLQLDAWNIPPQLRQSRWYQKITVTDVSVLLIPANPRRMSFVIGNPDGGANATTVFFTYQSPLPVPPDTFGLPIPSQTTYQESNGSVSIDDIFVLVDVLGAGQGFTNVIAYEGTLALEGHNQRPNR